MDKSRAEFTYKTAPMLGLSESDARTLLRAAQTLHTWAVHECNGTKQEEQRRIDDATYPGGHYWESTGIWHWYNPNTGNKCGRCVNLKAGALRRVDAICKAHGLGFEHQGDPRGYVLKLTKDGREFGVPSRG